jgi:hypothetical protein
LVENNNNNPSIQAGYFISFLFFIKLLTMIESITLPKEGGTNTSAQTSFEVYGGRLVVWLGLEMVRSPVATNSIFGN